MRSTINQQYADSFKVIIALIILNFKWLAHKFKRPLQKLTIKMIKYIIKKQKSIVYILIILNEGGIHMTKTYLGQKENSKVDIIAGVILMMAAFMSILKIEVIIASDVNVRVRANATGIGIIETVGMNLPLLIPILFALFSICFAKKKGSMLAIPLFIWSGGALIGDIIEFMFTQDNEVMDIITTCIIMCAHITLIMVITLTFYGVIKSGRIMGFTILITITIKLICVFLQDSVDSKIAISITGIIAHILFCIGLVALSFSLERFEKDYESEDKPLKSNVYAVPVYQLDTADFPNKEVRLCTKCGGELSDDSIFCTKCGNKV